MLQKTSANIQKFFPHKTIRPSQLNLVNDIENAILTEKIILAHAPTGLGKTASALAAALPIALEKKKIIFFLTNRHTQHKIAIETLKAIAQKTDTNIIVSDLIGKRWMCSQEIASLFGNDFNEYCKSVVEKGECEFYNKVRNKKSLTVEAKKILSDIKNSTPKHNEELITLCKQEGMCSYELSLALAKDAQVLIGDYYYLFHPFVQNTILTKLEKEIEDIIVVVDEGHNLPSRIAEMLSNSLSSFIIKNSLLEAKKFHYNGLIIWLQDLMSILTNLSNFTSQEYDKEKKVTKEEFFNQVNKIVNYDNLINELEMAADEIRKKQRRSYLGSIASFLASWKGNDEGYLRYINEKNSKYGPQIALHYICLDPSLITKDIFQRVHAGVIMSGTLKPTFMYKDILGITRGIEKEYSSPFPVENKLSLIIPETSTKYNLRGQVMYQTIAEKCSQMSQLIPGNVALFFPSYVLRDSISTFIKTKKKLFWEKPDMSKEEKEELLNQFKASKKEGALLLGVAGANFAEGIDLPGDLLNGVVIVGLPLAKPDLITKEIINYCQTKFQKGWEYGYIYPAMNKCFQSSGRCIRSEKDYGAVIYLDERFTWNAYFSCFDQEGLIVSKDYQKYLTKFFEP